MINISSRYNRMRKFKQLFPFFICLILVIIFIWQIVDNATDSDEDYEETIVMNEDGLDSKEKNQSEMPSAEPTLAPTPVPGWNLALLNKDNFMSDNYVPELAEVENNYYFDARAVDYLKAMLNDGRASGMDLRICSAYRDLDKQEKLYNDQVLTNMENGMSYDDACTEAIKVVAYPGTSEHNIGLAVDIVSGSYQQLDEYQANTKEAQWLKENCWRYGFILRYPLDKTEITGIIFEPWHYRYVGIEAAKTIMEEGICLEEYLDSPITTP